MAGRARTTGAAAAAALAVTAAVPPAQAASDAPTVHSQSCDEQVGLFPVAPEAVDVRLPEGFTLADPFGLGAPAVVVIAFTCDRVSWQRGAHVHELVGDQGALVLVTVEPPEELAGPQAEFHTLLLSMVVEEPRQAAVLRSIGIPTGTGRVSLDAGEQLQARVVDRGLDVLLESALGPTRTAPWSTHRIFTAREGRLVAAVDVAATAHVQSAPSPAAAEVTGLPLPSRLGGIGFRGTGLDIALVPVPGL